MLSRCFLRILNMSLVGGVAVLAVLLLRAVLPRAPRRLVALLWAAPLARLLLPFSFKSIFSLMPLRPDPLPQSFVTGGPARVDTGVSLLDEAVNGALPAPSPAASVDPMQVWMALGSLLWLAGVVGFLLYSLVSLFRLGRRLAGATPLRQNIWVAPGLETAFVLGLLRPRVYLPAGLSEEETRCILLHEQAHIRRGDPLWRLLAFAALGLHWFNPLAWVLFLALGRDMEMACDEAVLSALGEEGKKTYARVLLSLASGRRFGPGLPLAFGEGETKSRVKRILRYQKPAFWLVLAGAALALALVAALITDRAEPAAPEAPTLEGATPVEELLLARGDLGGGREVQLVLEKGETFTEEQAGAGAGVYPFNYRGDYRLQVVQGGAVLSTLGPEALQPLSFGGGALNFAAAFSLSLADYNGDGAPDFALGQWASSSMSAYGLFTVDGAGGLAALPVAGEEGGLFYAETTTLFSPLFTKEGEDGFLFSQYDNALGQPVEYLARWDGSAFQTAARAEAPGAEAFLAQLKASFTVEDGVASFTLPETFPEGYPPERLSVSVSGQMPEGDGWASLRAFEEEDAARAWTPGQTYRQQLFTGTPPDGTQVYASFYLIESGEDTAPGATETSRYYVTASLFFPLAEEQTPTVAVNGGQVVYTDERGQALSLTLPLPEGWALAAGSDLATPPVAFAALLKDGQTVGAILCDRFEIYRDESGLIPYRSVYSGLMLGSVASWDNEYTVVQSNPTAAWESRSGGEVATCRPRQNLSLPGVDNASAPTEYGLGILAYDTGLGKYIALSLDKALVSEEEWQALARGLVLGAGA